MNDNLIKRLRFCTTLPTLPAVAINIINLANDPDIDISKISHYISLDPALAAKIMKAANSPLYQSRHTSNNIRQAINVLGTHAVIVIALSFSLTNSLMRQFNNPTYDSNSFWRRSIASALACRVIGEKIGLKIPDDLFLAGLLQDIGILAYQAITPEEYEPVFTSTPDHDNLLCTERETFGAGHDELGFALLRQWNLPDYISAACITSHGQPTPNEIGPNIASCVAVSRHVAEYFLFPAETDKLSKVTNAAKLWLNLDNTELIGIIDAMDANLNLVEDLFEITIHDPKEISGILTEARELLTLQSLSKVRELEEKVQRDGLTGAHNRNYFDETLKREFHLSTQHALPLTLAMIDIDHFKRINDTYGHVAGDALLIAVVRTIFGQIRQDDTLSRYGGEEFALILPDTTLADSRSLLSRLKNQIANISHKISHSQNINVTVSIGVATHMNGIKNFEQPEDLIKAADLALYAAKHAGRNQIIEWNNSII